MDTLQFASTIKSRDVSVEDVLEDAAERIKEKYPESNVEGGNLLWQAWPQMWGSTACGFGGIGGAAMTRAQTIVAYVPGIDIFAVYHRGEFAYLLENPTLKFYDDMRNRELSGAAHLQTAGYHDGEDK